MVMGSCPAPLCILLTVKLSIFAEDSIVSMILRNDKLGLVTRIEGSIASVGAFVLPAILGSLGDTSGSFSLGWYLIGLVAFVGAIISLGSRRYCSELPEISTS